MAYTKTQWVNNTTPINDTNLNKIEQGIYDNSLVADAVTNTLNPTDTETYKTAELTEGQITDVIGVNDIVIKGQTSQVEEPTPNSPVDVNIVSGSNVINTSNKNLFDKNNIISGKYIDNSGNFVNDTNNYITNYFISIDTTKTYWTSSTNASSKRIAYYNASQTFISRELISTVSGTLTIPTNARYIRISGYLVDLDNTQLELGSTATTYEPHQGKELPLDLPVENLFDKSNITDGYRIDADGTLSSSANFITTDFITIQPNQKYYLPKINTRRLKYFNSSKQVLSSDDWDIASGEVGQILISPNNAHYVRFSIDKTKNDIDKFQFEKSSKANAYVPYGTEPIELCKIGDYQDYFYKSGSKWYLHKEIGKITLNGSESGGWTLRETNTNTMRLTTDGLVSPGILAYSQVYSKVFKGYSSNEDISNIDIPSIAPRDTGSGFTVRFPVSIATTVDGFKTWLSSNLPFVYYATSNVTNTEITDTTLISQLEAIYNAPLYEQTNITQTNNDLPMILDITACKDNINGIKAFIRK